MWYNNYLNKIVNKLSGLNWFNFVKFLSKFSSCFLWAFSSRLRCSLNSSSSSVATLCNVRCRNLLRQKGTKKHTVAHCPCVSSLIVCCRLKSFKSYRIGEGLKKYKKSLRTSCKASVALHAYYTAILVKVKGFFCAFLKLFFTICLPSHAHSTKQYNIIQLQFCQKWRKPYPTLLFSDSIARKNGLNRLIYLLPPLGVGGGAFSVCKAPPHLTEWAFKACAPLYARRRIEQQTHALKRLFMAFVRIAFYFYFFGKQFPTCTLIHFNLNHTQKATWHTSAPRRSPVSVIAPTYPPAEKYIY